MNQGFICYFLFLLSVSVSQANEFPKTLNPQGCTFRDMEQFFLEELGIGQVSIRYIQTLIPDPATKGYIKRASHGHYQIVLDKYLELSEIRITLAHELVHVRQLELGQINSEEFKKDYHERSFEDEAFRLSLPLAAKFYMELDCSGEK